MTERVYFRRGDVMGAARGRGDAAGQRGIRWLPDEEVRALFRQGAA
jgi:hypothetical protein